MTDPRSLSGADLLHAYAEASREWAAAARIKARKDALRDELVRRYGAADSLRSRAADLEAPLSEQHIVGPYKLRFTGKRCYYTSQAELLPALNELNRQGFSVSAHASIEPKWSKRLEWDAEAEEILRPAILGIGINKMAVYLSAHR